jgi:anti-sigma factor RsiW
MNNLPHHEHPAEEALMAFALQGEGDAKLAEHIDSCATCAETVKEFREVGRKVASLADEEVPERVGQRVLRLTSHGPAHGHQAPKTRGNWSAIGSLFSNPVFMALLVLLLLLALYFLVGTEVFKG